MREYLRTIAAYLTGWVIVQPLYNRLYRYWRRQHLSDPTPEDRLFFRSVATVLADELESRRKSDAAYKPGPAVSYPHLDGESLVLGPGVVASPDRSLIAWQGDVYHAEEQGMGTKAWRP